MEQREYKDRALTVCASGEMIFKRGQAANFAAVLVKGYVRVRTPYGGYRLQAGDVVGLFDIYAGEYVFDYLAQGEVQMVPIKAVSQSNIVQILSKDTKYIAFSVISLAGQMKHLYQSYETLYSCVKSTYQRMKISYEKYKNYAKKFAVDVPLLKGIDELRPEYEACAISDTTLQCVKEFGQITLEAVNGLYSNAPALAQMLLHEESNMIIQADKSCRDMLEYFKKEIILLSDRGEQNLFAGYYTMAAKIREIKGDNTSVLKELDVLSAEVDSISDTMENGLGIWIDLEAERLNDMRQQLNKEEEPSSDTDTLYNYSNAVVDSVTQQLKGLLQQLFDYVMWSEEKREEFTEVLTAYRLQQSTDFSKESAREAIRNFENAYYELYEQVFFMTEEDYERDEETPKNVKLFLDYAILSEQFFGENELLQLYHAAMGNQWNSEYSIHTLSEWLHLIYIGEREPSKNEFDEDYRDSLKQLKKKKSMTPQEEEKYLNDSVAKVQYEIKNMIRLNNRILFASNATFCPYVYGEEFSKDITKQIMTAQDISNAITKIRNIDFSLFYREQLYRVEAPKPENLHIMMEVLPDIILIPNVGGRGSMWQEIGSKRRTSPARFVLPMYPLIAVEEMMYPLMGKYRWEFCRTEQGTRWNDITEKSLTSEYFDYAQFYKKNNDLSDAAKQKIKDKLTSSRNNICEVFIADYISWVRFESQGSSRLNKVAREIVAQYCPFSGEVRAALHSNPMFDELLKRKEMKMEKKARELAAHYQSLEKNGVAITEELINHLEYFKK